jgi:hypothetical protein
MTSSPLEPPREAAQIASLDRRIRVISGVSSKGAFVKRVSDLRAFPYVVLIGEPGSGKSTVLRWEATQQGVPLVTVRTLMTQASSQPGAMLFVDALDEYRMDGQPRDKVHGLAIAISSRRPSQWWLTCRAEDWRKEADAGALRQAAPGEEIVVAQLLPLSLDEAACILTILGERDPQSFLSRAKDLGASGFIESPLSLRLLHKAVSADGQWPNKRHDLFASAIVRLAHEHNTEYKAGARRSVPDIIEAAEVACLTLLISGRRAIWRSHGEPPTAGADPRAYLRAYELKCEAAVVDNMLDSSLFRGEGEEFEPIHRTVAEFLGSRALAKAVVGSQGRAALPLGRATAMITAWDNVPPTELRGLYAWFAAHLARLHAEDHAQQLIEADAATVLMYGDAQTFSTSLRRAILNRLGRKNPYFRTADDADVMVASLAGDDLAEDFKLILGNPSDRTQRLATVFEALTRGSPIETLRPILRDITLEPKRPDWQRIRAAAAWMNGQPQTGARELFGALRAEPLSPAREELRSYLATYLAPSSLTVTDIRSLLSDFEATRYGSTVGRLISLGMALQEAPPAELFDDPLNSWLPLSGRPGDSIDLQQFIDGLLAAAISKTPDLTAGRLWRWVCNARRHTWESLQERSSSALRGWLEADISREQGFLAAVMADHPPSHAPWEPKNSFHTIVGRMPSAAVVRGLFVDSTRIQDPDESKRLLAIAVEIACNHRDDDVYQEALNIVSAQSECADLKQRLLATRDESAAQRRAEREQERLVRLTQRRAKNIEILRPLLSELSMGKHPHHLGQAAQDYFARPNNKRNEGRTRGIERLIEDTDELIAQAIVEGWRHLATTDLNSIDARMMGTTAAQGSFYFVELAAVAGLDRLLAENSLHEIGTMPVTLAIAVLKCSPLLQNSEERTQLETWAIDRLNVDPGLGAAQILDFWCAALDAGATYLESLHGLPAREQRGPAFGAALDRLLSSRPGMPSSVLDRAILAASRHLAPARLLELSAAALADTTLPVTPRRTWRLVAFMLDPRQHRESFLRDHGEHAELVSMQDAFRSFGLEGLAPVDHSARIDRAAILARLIAKVQPPEDGSSPAAGTAYLGDIANGAIHWLTAQCETAAGAALEELACAPDLARWEIQLRYAHATWARGHRERTFKYPLPGEVLEALSGGPPLNASDLRAIVLEELQRLVRELHSSDITLWKQYWNRDSYGNATQPLIENQCRDQLLSLLRPRLERYNITAALPEIRRGEETRADVVVLCGARCNLPVEIKRHFNPDIWTAPRSQLQGYTSSEGAGGYGVYVVFWFGSDVQQPPKRPDRSAGPRSASVLEAMLGADLPADARDLVRIVVFDVSRPVSISS